MIRILDPESLSAAKENDVFSHVMVGSDDLEAARRFYDAIFETAGGRAGRFDEKGRLFYAKDGTFFMVSKPVNGKPATSANGGTIGFHLPAPEAVDAWQAAGIANGGKAIEDPPGIREMYGRKMYLAYLSDPTGNKLCAMAVPPG